MSVFSLERRDTSFENPSIPISSDSIISLLGTGITTDSGVHVSEFNAMRLSAVWRCVSILSGVVAGLPLQVFSGNRDDPGPKQPVDKSILYTAPEGLTMFEFKEQLMTHLLLWGNAYIRKVWNRAGDQVVQLILYRPWEVTASRLKGPGSPKTYDVINGDKKLTDDDIIHVPGLGYDGIRGLSPIQFARQSVGLGVAVEQYGAKFFGNGAMLGGIIKSQDRIPQEKAEQVKNRFRDKLVGLARAHEVAVLDSGLDYMPLQIPPETAQFLATRQFSVNEIARWYGVPPHLIGDVDKTTSWGTGIAEQTLGFVRFTVSFWVSRIEQRLSTAIPAGQFAAFDMDALLRADANQRAVFYHNAITDGWMSRAEIRALEALPQADPAYGLDQFEMSLTEQISAKVATAVSNALQPKQEPQSGQTKPNQKTRARSTE
jgi:HK97 family phage portal protein